MDRIIDFTLILSVLVFLLPMSCKTTAPDQAYLEEIESWREARLRSLTSARGWTTLAGLYWLGEGENTIGNTREMDIRFGSEKTGEIGIAFLKNDSIYFLAAPGQEVKPFNEGLVKTDASGKPDIFSLGQYTWYFIERGEKYGLRLRDTLHPARYALRELPHFKVTEEFRFEARVLGLEESRSVDIANQIGQVSGYPIEGLVRFDYKGKEHELIAFDGGEDSFWIIFSDQTTGDGTYGGGRYLYIPRPDSSGMTNVDFNRAYNPPCVYTDFATCPLPPRENTLPFKVRAGEKYVGNY